MEDAPFLLPSPPTLEQRLDAAAEASWRRAWKVRPGGDIEWADESPEEKRAWLLVAETACRAFAPEHFKDTDNNMPVPVTP